MATEDPTASKALIFLVEASKDTPAVEIGESTYREAVALAETESVAPTVEELGRTWEAQHKYRATYDLVVLAQGWNAVAPDALRIDPAPIVEPERVRYRELLEEFLSAAQAAGFARPFGDRWTQRAKASIDSWAGNCAYEGPVAFIQALQDGGPSSFFRTLADRIRQVQCALPPGRDGQIRKAVKRRLADVSVHGPLGVLFELNVMALLVELGVEIEAYEPELDSGKHVEAACRWEGVRFFVECTIKTQFSERAQQRVGQSNPGRDADIVASAIISEKLEEQLIGVDLPVLLVVGLGIGQDHRSMPFMLRDRLFGLGSAGVVGALAVCDSHRAEKRVLYPGPISPLPESLLDGLATHPAPEGWHDALVPRRGQRG